MIPGTVARPAFLEGKVLMTAPREAILQRVRQWTRELVRSSLRGAGLE